MKIFLKSISGLFFLLLLVACESPELGGGTAFPNATALYGTIAAQLTETAQATASQAIRPTLRATQVSQTPSSVPDPESSPTLPQKPRTTPTPTVTSIPCNLAAAGRPFVDITIPDGTRLMPGEPFSKTWRLVNVGSCAWTNGYSIVWFSGDLFGAVGSQAFDNVVLPGNSVDITVDMVAPKQPGLHQSNWKLADAQGNLFGIGPNGDAPFWVRIEVVQVATDTPTSAATLTATPTPAIAAEGSLLIELDKPVDLDTGKTASEEGEDLVLRKGEEDALQLVPMQGAIFAKYGMGTPMQNECQAAELGGDPIPTQGLKDGEVYCYRTHQGLPGYFRIQSLELADGKMTIDFQTWALP